MGLLEESPLRRPRLHLVRRMKKMPPHRNIFTQAETLIPPDDREKGTKGQPRRQQSQGTPRGRPLLPSDDEVELETCRRRRPEEVP